MCKVDTTGGYDGPGIHIEHEIIISLIPPKILSEVGSIVVLPEYSKCWREGGIFVIVINVPSNFK